MLTYSLLRLDPESSASERLTSKAPSLRAQLEHGLKEVIYNVSRGFEISRNETLMG